MLLKPLAKYTIIGIICLIGLSSCNTTRYIQDDERLLRGNSIKLDSKGKIDQKRSLNYQLSLLYKQQENNRFLFIPREWFYFSTQEAKEDAKFANWQRRVIAEKPSIYEESLTESTEESMTFFLQNKGYFNAFVYSTKLEKKKKIYITYHVKPGVQFTIDTVGFYSRDTAIHKLLQKIAPATYLKKGDAIDGKHYERERERITSYLRDHGYAYFYSNFILPLEADTTAKAKKVKLALEVIPPYIDSSHQAYKIGHIDVYTDYAPGQETCCLLDTVINNIRFHSPHPDFQIDPGTINNAIYLKKGSFFSQNYYDKTNEQLSSLGVFRFVRIKQFIDTLDNNKLNIRIELTQNKKIELGFDLEFNFASRNASGAGNLIGLTASPSLRNRNLLKGAELHITDFSAGVEFSPNPSDIAEGVFWNTVDLRVQSSLYLPRFTDYLSLWRGVNRLYQSRQEPPDDEEPVNTLYEDMVENAVTRISASYNYLLIRNFYQYDLFTATYGFDFQRTNNRRLLINHIGIDYLFPQTRPEFESILDLNPFLERSFGKQLFVSFLFRDLNYVYNSRPNSRGNSYYIGYNLEMAGAEVAAYNRIAGDNLRLRLRPGSFVDFSEYIRTEIDLRSYWQKASQKSVAVRFAFGIARPFGTTLDVPYVKQFFVGGPNSVRAWSPRGLGPGAYEDPLSTDRANNTRLYQTGDIKIEANLEYRFKIFWLMNGALFLDAGNVWTIENDDNRPGSQFRISSKLLNIEDNEGNMTTFLHEPFYKQIAVGGGFGLRFDFSYFILRLDLATKLRHSYPFMPASSSSPMETDYWFRDFRDGSYDFSKIAFNLGFGYPF
jgi:outer membrane protein insertion porin family